MTAFIRGDDTADIGDTIDTTDHISDHATDGIETDTGDDNTEDNISFAFQ